MLPLRTAIPQDMPVLNVMSAADKFFSQANSWLDNPSALGHAGRTLANHTDASIVLIREHPHALCTSSNAVRSGRLS